MNIGLSIPEDTEAQCPVETVEIHSKSCLQLLAAHSNSIFMTNLIMLIHGLHLLVYRHSSHL